jgi:hypothetical protein
MRTDHAALLAIMQRMDAAMLASQQEQILAELAKMRTDHAALLAIVQSRDATVRGVSAYWLDPSAQPVDDP